MRQRLAENGSGFIIMVIIRAGFTLDQTCMDTSTLARQKVALPLIVHRLLMLLKFYT